MSMLQSIERLFLQKAAARFRRRSFFEKVWVLAIFCLPLQLWAMYFSFESECLFVMHQIIMGESQWGLYQAYMLAFVFEAIKATVIGVAIRQFLMAENEFVWWAVGGLALSVGSWWMSDQGTFYITQTAVGSSPTNVQSAQIVAAYSPQIEVLKKEALDLERENFWWCGLHRTKHTNNECNAKASGYYVNTAERADQLAKAKIEELKQHRLEVEKQMNGELSLASQHHQQQLGEHQALAERTQISLQNKVLVSEAVIWACTLAVSYILFRLYREQKETLGNAPTTGGSPRYGRRLQLHTLPNYLHGRRAVNGISASENTRTSAVHWSLEADGHRINCDECQQEAVLIHPGRFCSDECRMEWHKRRRKSKAAGT